MDDAERELLAASKADHDIVVHVVVRACSYTCCGRGWQRREGYEQDYYGYVGVLDDFAFMLYNPGLGAPSYVIAAKIADIELAERAR